MKGLTSPKGELSRVGHGIALVKDDKLDALAHELLGAAERFDFFSHHIDASVVRRVKL